jgi:hypothetical protein
MRRRATHIVDQGGIHVRQDVASAIRAVRSGSAFDEVSWPLAGRDVSAYTATCAAEEYAAAIAAGASAEDQALRGQVLDLMAARLGRGRALPRRLLPRPRRTDPTVTARRVSVVAIGGMALMGLAGAGLAVYVALGLLTILFNIIRSVR